MPYSRATDQEIRVAVRVSGTPTQRALKVPSGTDETELRRLCAEKVHDVLDGAEVLGVKLLMGDQEVEFDILDLGPNDVLVVAAAELAPLPQREAFRGACDRGARAPLLGVSRRPSQSRAPHAGSSSASRRSSSGWTRPGRRGGRGARASGARARRRR